MLLIKFIWLAGRTPPLQLNKLLSEQWHKVCFLLMLDFLRTIESDRIKSLISYCGLGPVKPVITLEFISEWKFAYFVIFERKLVLFHTEVYSGCGILCYWEFKITLLCSFRSIRNWQIIMISECIQNVNDCLTLLKTVGILTSTVSYMIDSKGYNTWQTL